MIADLQRQLGIDSSFFQQFFIFIVIFTWLRVIYFGPFLKLIQKREGQSEGLSDEAKKLEEESVKLEAQAQDALATARKKALAEREAILGVARKEANEIVLKSREQAKGKLDGAREAAARSADVETASLRPQASSISAMLVQKLMNTKVGL
jgi:F0F1-type ATP synthase membrane subunit b/b'